MKIKNIEKTYEKIELENKFKKLIEGGMTREEAVSKLVDDYGLEKANYLIEAYLMPIDEITEEIKRYDNANPKLDEIAFVKDLCTRYNVDRKAIIERIRDVRVINMVKSQQTKERLDELKAKRDMLQEERLRLNNKKISSDKNGLYLTGLLTTSIASLILFYPESPILVALITMAYAAGIPAIRMDKKLTNDKNIVDELVDLGKEIEFIENSLSDEEDYVTSSTIEGPTLIKK